MEADVKRAEAHVYAEFGRQPRRRQACAGMSLVTSEGVTFDAFFHASMLLPVNGAEEMLLTGLTGAFPIAPATRHDARNDCRGRVYRRRVSYHYRTDRSFKGGPRYRAVYGCTIRHGHTARAGYSASELNLANVVQVRLRMASALRSMNCWGQVLRDPSHPAIMEKFLLGGLRGGRHVHRLSMYVVQNRQAAARTGQYMV